MKKTLYDFLGVRRDASRAEIEKAYDRLKSMYGGDGGAEVALRDGYSMPLVEDAFATLSNPAKRESYDASLQRAAKSALEARYASTMEPEATVSGRTKWAMLVLAVLMLGGLYLKVSHEAQVEKERNAAELRRIEAERLTAEAEAERLRAENERETTRLAAEERRTTREQQMAIARSSTYRAQTEYSEAWRQENERRMAEREKAQREAMERQRLAQEQYQRQMRDEQDRRYLDSFDRRSNQVFIYQLPRR